MRQQKAVFQRTLSKAIYGMDAVNASLQINSRNNYIRVPSFILSGAPNFRHSRTKVGTKARV
jgi:hypothetical protein